LVPGSIEQFPSL